MFAALPEVVNNHGFLSLRPPLHKATAVTTRETTRKAIISDQRNRYATDEDFSLFGQTQETLAILVHQRSAGGPRRKHEVRYSYLGSH